MGGTDSPMDRFSTRLTRPMTPEVISVSISNAEVEAYGFYHERLVVFPPKHSRAKSRLRDRSRTSLSFEAAASADVVVFATISRYPVLYFQLVSAKVHPLHQMK